MISDYVLEHLDSCDKDTLHGICKELLAYREAERKANSWDNSPSDATHRAVRREKYIYYNACEIAYMEDCNIRTDKLEERPK